MRELEHRFGNRLAIIGVHSAKYTTEGSDVHLREAVRRLGVDHPVVNDRGMDVWQGYAVRAWPTLMFMDPNGRVIGKHEGEFDPDALSDVIAAMIAEFAGEGLLRDEPIAGWEPTKPESGAFAFPAGIATSSDYLYVSDTRHHRVLELSVDGEVRRQFGSGEPGFLDGAHDKVSFHDPHGLALDDDALYVADTGNHAVRRIDLKTGGVTTLAGTGRLARSYSSGGPALETDLRSPWDVAVVSGVLYIAMAGNHQLWMHKLGSREVRRYAGTGHEGKRDDTVPRAWLAQPVALDSAGDRLVFCDAETSSVRVCDALSNAAEGAVETLVGKDLFDWGDVDGDFDSALLQHVSGVAVDSERGTVYVSDTYNNKIKRLDLRQRTIETVAGTGETGHDDGHGLSARFFEPHGLALVGDTLYVADTNNHAVRKIDLASGVVSTSEICE